ncbi:MAG: M56 family metallopeptidase [Verrucomicrobiales bacterium]|nr:M56 family metallopeptidase [Verrucomicrobiales bacterium]
MTRFANFFSPDPEEIAGILLFSWWSGFAILIGVGAVVTLGGKLSARHRVSIYFVALLLCLCSVPVGIYVAKEQAHQLPFSEIFRSVEVMEPVDVSADSVEEAPELEPVLVSRKQVAPITQWMVIGYVAGLVLMSIRFFFGLGMSRRLARLHRKVEDKQIVRAFRRLTATLQLRSEPILGYCEAITVPVVVGMVRPIVLLPTRVLDRVTGTQLEMILAHELSHIKRNDHRLIFLQRLAETVLFFHPGVWIISRWLNRERENACDDLVVSLGCSRADYAGALVAVSELSQETAGILSLAADGNMPSELSRRVYRILNLPCAAPVRFSRGAFSLMVLFTIGMGMGLTPDTQGVARPDIASLEDEVGQLKEQIADAESLAPPPRQVDLRMVIEENREKAQRIIRAKENRYPDALNKEVEIAYQNATNGTVADLEAFIEKYSEHNRAGCAALIAGQRAQTSDKKQKYLKLAINDYSNSYFPEGSQVTPIARFYLGQLFLAEGKTEKANKHFEAILERHPTATTIHGNELLATATEELKNRPRIIRASPYSGEQQVSPGPGEIRVEFDRPMDQTTQSFSRIEKLFPRVTGEARWINSHTIVVPVKLKASKKYGIGINTSRKKNFRSEQGYEAADSKIFFRTVSKP